MTKMKLNLENLLMEHTNDSIATLCKSAKGSFTTTELLDLILLCESKDLQLAYDVMLAALEAAPSEIILQRLSEFFTQHPYFFSPTPGKGPELSRFQDAVHKIISEGKSYSQYAIANFLYTLELLFAYGYHTLRSEITALYRLMETTPYACDETFRIQQQLAVVYQYNGRNFRHIKKMLKKTRQYCKCAGLHHLKRVVHYYYAVLMVLRNDNSDQSHLQKACEKKYPLAHILRDHSEINSETPKRSIF